MATHVNYKGANVTPEYAVQDMQYEVILDEQEYNKWNRLCSNGAPTSELCKYAQYLVDKYKL